jgi:hypothetical protein
MGLLLSVKSSPVDKLLATPQTCHSGDCVQRCCRSSSSSPSETECQVDRCLSTPIRKQSLCWGVVGERQSSSQCWTLRNTLLYSLLYLSDPWEPIFNLSTGCYQSKELFPVHATVVQCCCWNSQSTFNYPAYLIHYMPQIMQHISHWGGGYWYWCKCWAIICKRCWYQCSFTLQPTNKTATFTGMFSSLSCKWHHHNTVWQITLRSRVLQV